MKMSKRILVTGAEGFIGRMLVRALRAADYEVLTHSMQDGDIAQNGLEYTDVSHIYHLAALTYVPNSWENPHEFYRVNIMGTESVLELCRKVKSSLTFMSTYVYGHPQYTPIDEQHPVAPNTPYNHGKHLAEQLCRFYHDTFKIKVSILRPFNIYGYGQASSFLIPEIIGQILDPHRYEVELMSLLPKRDYVYINDVINALISTMKQINDFEIFNIGSGSSFSVLEIATEAMRACGIEKKVISRGIERPNEVTDICANISKAAEKLHWVPKYDLFTGLKEMVAQWNQKAKL